MVKRINLLDENTSNKIAAGEVVEGPSSVIKELLENSIDSGAKNITIEIEEGGEKSIKIIDDGWGIHPLDIKKAFMSHATSKISTVEDLNKISTLGFRGEALCSIASVSNTILKSKAEGFDVGNEIIISGGVLKGTQEIGCNKGTTILVEDLFFNVPARKKFLKSPSREAAGISDIVTRLSLANPDISFKFFKNGKKALTTYGTGKVMDVAMSIASTVEEVHLRRPELGRRELFESGMHVGRDTMGTMSNTLILAFAGGSLGVLVTYYAYQLPYLQIINSYGVGIEIMQGISGSMGIILTVPIVSAASAAWMAPARAAEGAEPLPLPRRIERAVSPAAGFLKKYWKLLTALVCIAVLVLCAGKLYRVFSAYAQGGREYEAVRSSVETPQPGAAALSDAAAPTAEEKFRFDFGRLAAQNPDTVGWLRLPGTALSYPVVQGKDNSYYLTHTFSRRENKVGAVFLDSRIRQGLSAPNCVVYGHNMNDGSMFASVWEFRNKSYFQAHPVIELYSKSGEKVCPVFSAHEVKPDGDAYRLSFSGSKAYGAYLKQMKKASLYDTGVDVAASDRVLTLSTCVRDGRDVRFLVHAKIPG